MGGDGWSWTEGDCGEGDPTIAPDKDEQWYDGVDQNCDGRDDDRDGDGLLASADCDDQNPAPCCGSQSSSSMSPLWGLFLMGAWRRRKTE